MPSGRCKAAWLACLLLLLAAAHSTAGGSGSRHWAQDEWAADGWAASNGAAATADSPAADGRAAAGSGSHTAANMDTCSKYTFFDDVIQDQLAPYRRHGIHPDDLTGAEQAAMLLNDVGQIKIVDGKIYLRALTDNGRIVRFTALVFGMLACKFQLPDVLFDYEVSGHIYNRRSVLTTKDPSDPSVPPPPVFGYVRHNVYTPDLLLIPYQLASQNRRQLQREFLLEAEMGIWERRMGLAFWRGTTTGQAVNERNVWELPRTQLLVACHQLQEACDAKYTGVVQAKNNTDRVRSVLDRAGLLNSKKKPREDLLRYKYLLMPDGNVAATSRSLTYFRSAAVVLKPHSPFEEFWYPKLIPYRHFIPLGISAFELNTTLKWLRQNDDHAQAIGKRGRAFVMDHLTVEGMECYVLRLLRAYSKLMRFKVTAPTNSPANSPDGTHGTDQQQHRSGHPFGSGAAGHGDAASSDGNAQWWKSQGQGKQPAPGIKYDQGAAALSRGSFRPLEEYLDEKLAKQVNDEVGWQCYAPGRMAPH